MEPTVLEPSQQTLFWNPKLTHPVAVQGRMSKPDSALYYWSEQSGRGGPAWRQSGLGRTGDLNRPVWRQSDRTGYPSRLSLRQ
jgi:hypothetical protein